MWTFFLYISIQQLLKSSYLFPEPFSPENDLGNNMINKLNRNKNQKPVPSTTTPAGNRDIPPGNRDNSDHFNNKFSQRRKRRREEKMATEEEELHASNFLPGNKTFSEVHHGKAQEEGHVLTNKSLATDSIAPNRQTKILIVNGKFLLSQNARTHTAQQTSINGQISTSKHHEVNKSIDRQ